MYLRCKRKQSKSYYELIVFFKKHHSTQLTSQIYICTIYHMVAVDVQTDTNPRDSL